jgi:hypothetical protein
VRWKGSRAGALPYQPVGATPLEECDGITRMVYAATAKRQESAVSMGFSKDLAQPNGRGVQLNQLGVLHD